MLSCRGNHPSCSQVISVTDAQHNTAPKAAPPMQGINTYSSTSSLRQQPGVAYKSCSVVIDDQLDGSVPVSRLTGKYLHSSHMRPSNHSNTKTYAAPCQLWQDAIRKGLVAEKCAEAHAAIWASTTDKQDS
jgi:hypothetical protein